MENNITSNNNKSSIYITILILLCTSLIILTNYISSNNNAKNVHDQIMQIEYNKIWWKENYDILRELQKKEVLIYLDTIRKEKPELIQEVKNRLKALENNYNFLDNQSIWNFKKDTYIKWNTWAIISIIEFSDLECEHCIEFHKSNILGELIEQYQDDTNYIFKNFPLPTYKNSTIEAEATKCIEKLSNWESYLNFIDKIYNTTNGWWEWLELSNLSDFASELDINKENFEKCLENWDYSEQIKNEFNQGINLWIDSVPSTVILNNQTGEYIIIKENTEKEKIEKIILDFINSK
jgi:predicted DsbA family dithiol-disulfide isomerase